jgi:hypothetical protein
MFVNTRNESFYNMRAKIESGKKTFRQARSSGSTRDGDMVGLQRNSSKMVNLDLIFQCDNLSDGELMYDRLP